MDEISQKIPFSWDVLRPSRSPSKDENQIPGTKTESQDACGGEPNIYFPDLTVSVQPLDQKGAAAVEQVRIPLCHPLLTSLSCKILRAECAMGAQMDFKWGCAPKKYVDSFVVTAEIIPNDAVLFILPASLAATVAMSIVFCASLHEALSCVDEISGKKRASKQKQANFGLGGRDVSNRRVNKLVTMAQFLPCIITCRKKVYVQ